MAGASAQRRGCGDSLAASLAASVAGRCRRRGANSRLPGCRGFATLQALLRLLWTAALLLLPLIGQHGLPLRLQPDHPFVAEHHHSGKVLPQNSIGDLAMTADGRLWVGTFGGLCSFDGHNWRLHDATNTPGMPGSRVLALCADDDGGLWVGMDRDGLLRCHGGRLLPVPGFTDRTVTSICRLADGRLLVASASDVYEVATDGLRPCYPSPLPGVRRLLDTPAGPVAGGLRGLMALRPDGPVLLHPDPVRAMAPAAAGGLYLGLRQGLFHYLAGQLVQVPESLAQPIDTMHCDAAGNLWYASIDQLAWRRPGAAQDAFRCGLHRSLRCILVDHSEGIWLGSIGGGLVRLRHCELRLHGPAEGLWPNGQNAVALAEDGDLLVATYAGLFRRQDDRYALVPGLPTAPLTALLPVSGHHLWVATAEELWLLREMQLVARWPLPAALGQVHALQLVDGELWLGTAAGLAVLRGDSFQSPDGAKAMLGAAKLLVHDDAGGLWIGGPDCVLHLSADRRSSRRLQPGRDLPAGDLRGVLSRPDGSTWLAFYGGGLCWLPAGAQRMALSLDRRHGLLDHHLCSMVATPSVAVVGSNRGPFLIDLLQLDALANGSIDTLACRPVAGPVTPEIEASGGFQPSAVIAGERAFLCGIGPLLALDLSRLAARTAAPQCHIERLLLDGEPHAAAALVALPAGMRSLGLELTACEFDRPEQLRFRWRLLPTSPEWSRPTFERNLHLDLPGAGSYQFEAQALTFAGLASTPCSFQVEVPPLWHERRWAQVGLFIALLLLGVLAHHSGGWRLARRELLLQQLVQARTAELRQAHANLETRVQERTTALQLALQKIDTDHRQRRRLERELELLRRMESLGQLAGSVAHDFNNLLTIVLGNTELLLLQLGDDVEVCDLLARIRDAGERGRRLTRHLLAVASRQTVVPVCLDLNEQLQGAAGMLQDLCGPGVDLQLRVAAEPAPVLAAPGQVEQILLNLVVNARDAMPGGGTLAVEVSVALGKVELCVRDQGVGMTQQVRERAFEPFFTTKTNGKGTGLGLATVYGITKQMGGEIELWSEVGQGTVVRCRWPLSSAVAPSEAVLLPLPPLHAPPGTILLVDDEIDVRRALRRLLERAGCAVVEAGCGAEALAILDRSAATIRAIISDLRMPGPSGPDLVDAIHARWPGMPVVCLTGHAGDTQSLPVLHDLGVETLEKPPAVAELLQAVQRAQAATRLRTADPAFTKNSG